MKLDLTIISTYLSEHTATKIYGVGSDRLSFPRPRLFGPGIELAPGRLYVARAGDLSRCEPVPGVGIVCAGDRVSPAWTTGGTQVLLLTGERDLLSAFNLVSGIYDYFDDWDRQLRDELEKEADFDISRLLLLAAQVLGNPLNVVGRTLQNLFTMEREKGADSSQRFTVNDHPGEVPPAYKELIKQVCGLERALTVPYLSSIDLPNQQSYCYNLYLMDHFVGCVSVSTWVRPFRESDFPLADHFFAYFQKAFFKYLRNNEQTLSPGAAALQKLLRGEYLSVEERALFQLSPGESWVVMKLREARGKKAFPRDYMCGTISALMPQNLYAAMHHKEIIGLLRIKDDDDAALEPFGDLLRRMDYYAGVSGSFQEIEQLHDYLIQANYVAERHGDRLDGETLYYFRDYALEYLLQTCTLEMPPSALVSRGLLRLAEHDKNKGTEYMRTLDVYLRNEMSITKTSEALYIHRSSLMKRLNKIKEFLRDDLSDPDTRLYYRLCLALLKFK